MKKIITTLACILSLFPMMSQNNTHKHQLSFDFGSYRNRYLYPITDIQYRSALIKNSSFSISARLRSYSTLFFYSKTSYDFTPIAYYFIRPTLSNWNFSAGAGIDTRLRLVKDIRSDGKSSAEPLISLGFHYGNKKILFHNFIWTRFYSNGISFSLQPEASYQLGKHYALFLRYELSYLSIYKVNSHEWRQDNFIGMHFQF